MKLYKKSNAKHLTQQLDGTENRHRGELHSSPRTGKETASTDRVINYRGSPLLYLPDPAPRPAYHLPHWGVTTPTSQSSKSNSNRNTRRFVGFRAAQPPRCMTPNLHSNRAPPRSRVWFGPVAAPQPRRVARYANTDKALGLCSRWGLKAMQN